MAEIENIHCPICTQPIPSSWQNGLPPALATNERRGDQWFYDGFWSPKPLVAMVFQWFPMVANHWSDDGMVMIHRSGLFGSIGKITFHSLVVFIRFLQLPT